jgi:phosphoribosylaminoimidazole-succinocarboxamide synthase
MNTKIPDDVYVNELPHTIKKTGLALKNRVEGKVRDIYDLQDKLLLVTTDRLSAFDRRLTTVPFKGQVLNQISAFWFEQTKDIVPNHMLSMPYANAMLVKKIKVFPIEFVVRGYITGSTNTSLWTLYQEGERQFGGRVLPDNLTKHQKLPEPLLTPTTKAVEGDRPIEREGIIQEGFMSEEDWEKASAIALKLFDKASKMAKERDLILVDTKFEMGKDEEGNIVLVDEALTPDSSRYWRASNYQAHIAKGEDPDNFDKEMIRLWYKKQCDPYKDKLLPDAPDELRVQVSKIYVALYEQMTGRQFQFDDKKLDESITSLD